jgi:GNAT superfamily N-acetyltransferase
VLVRPATDTDGAAIADVYIASYGGLTFLPKLHSDDETRAWIRGVVLPMHEVWVAENDAGVVVGFAALSDDMLMWMYVHPDAQNRGAGSTLLGKVKQRRPSGFRLWTFQRNAGARRFYERHGCRLVELTDGSGNEECEPDALYAWEP